MKKIVLFFALQLISHYAFCAHLFNWVKRHPTYNTCPEQHISKPTSALYANTIKEEKTPEQIRINIRKALKMQGKTSCKLEPGQYCSLRGLIHFFPVGSPEYAAIDKIARDLQRGKFTFSTENRTKQSDDQDIFDAVWNI